VSLLLNLKVRVTDEDLMNDIALLMCFARFYTRKINTTFTITTTSLFCGQTLIHHTADVENCAGKKYDYYNGLNIHVTKILHF